MSQKRLFLITTVIILIFVNIILGFFVLKKFKTPPLGLEETNLERLKIGDKLYVDLSPTVALVNNQGQLPLHFINQGKKTSLVIKTQLPKGLTLNIKNRNFRSENFNEVIKIGQYNFGFNDKTDFTVKLFGVPEDANKLILYFNDYQQMINLVIEGGGETPNLAQDVNIYHLYYVAKDGNDNNDGSEKTPFLTITKAAQLAKPGNTVFVKAGTYEETITPLNSGQDGKMITFTNYQNDQVIIQAKDGYGFYLGYGINYIKVNGLTITRAIGASAVSNYPKTTAVAHGAGVKINASNHHLITNNTFYDNDIGVFISEGAPFGATDGLVVSQNNEIVNNVIYNSGEAGIRIKRSDYTTIDNNKIYHNGFTANPVYDEPAAGLTYYCAIGTTITNNTIYDNSNLAIENYAGTNPTNCDSEDTVIKNNVLSQTNPSPLTERVYGSKKIVLSIAQQEITDTTHLYQYNSFYNGEVGSAIISWGVNNLGDQGELLAFNQFQERIQSLNPNSGLGNQEVATNPIQ